jgi:hypothetical protein
MNETIRAYLKRRVRWCLAIAIAGWLIIIATSVGGRGANPGFPMLGFLTFGGAIVALQWIKCPRCVVRLGQLAMILGVPGLKPQPNFCPYCGVSLDEPRTRLAPGAEPTAVNPIS